MKKLNSFIILGLLLNTILLLVNQINLFPEFIKGLFAGLGLALIFVGMYSENHDISKLRNYKKNLLNRILSK